MSVRTVSRWVDGPEGITDLLGDTDLVIAGIDKPDDIDLWVNQVCVTAGVPYVRGGMLARRMVYWSVDPGRSACRACYEHAWQQDKGAPGVPEERLSSELDRVNRGIGPVSSLVGAQVAMEALRYLTGFASPIAAGCEQFVDLATGQCEVKAWPRWAGCPVCAAAPPTAGKPRRLAELSSSPAE